jgi:hypothetical protein
MNGVKLSKLPAADLLDVIHYMFEKDLEDTIGEYAEAKDLYRIRLYEDMYETTYPYASPSTKNSPFNPDLPPFDEEEFGEPEGLSNGVPAKKKGFIPATEFIESAPNPYHGVLDAPLG